MRTQIRYLARLGLAAGIALLVSGCDRGAAQADAATITPPRWLNVVTPHNQRIQRAFGTGFSEWYFRQHNQTVYVEWIERSTPECIEFVQRVADAGRRDSRVHADVVFGGGIADHELLAERELSRAIQIDDVVRSIPAELAGLPTRDPQGRWFATGLSSFGFVYNEKVCAERQIAPPQTWDDLADPRFASWLGLADPARSGSHLQCMVIVVQKHGWEEGWGRLVRMLANSRALVDRASAAIQQTGTGIFLAALAVNFDGQNAEATSGGSVRYRNPSGATAVTPDLISVATTRRDDELATAFVRFCLSEEGQRLWVTPPADESAASLYHFPILPQVYHSPGQPTLAENPYETDFGVRYNVEQARWQGPMLSLLVEAAAGENHVLLQRAWEATIRAGLPESAVRELCAAPLSESQAAALGATLRAARPEETAQLAREWSERFRELFERVLASVQ